jgi:hypothetical protein
VDPERVRRTSKVLVGNRYRLEIASAVAQLQSDIFHAKELADALGLPLNVVSQQVKAFVTVGVCEDVPAVAGQRQRFFRRVPCSYWTGCAVLLDELSQLSSR